MKNKIKEKYASYKFLFNVGFFIIVCAVVQLLVINYYNNKLHTVFGKDDSQEIYMDIHYRGDNTATWEKIDAGLTGVIYDGSIKNNSKYTLNSWTLTVNINNDCYLNQFWNGDVEIHQYVGTENATVQKINLANYDLDELKLDYIIDGSDLLIHLQPGDYIVYYPSSRINEYPIEPDGEIIVGMIVYYADELELTDYHLDYYYHINFTSGEGFIFFVALVAIWLVAFIIYATAFYINRKNASRDELRKSGISCMSELYSIIYIVNLIDDTLIPVYADEQSEGNRPKEMGANDQFTTLFLTDSEPEYMDLMLDFSDLETLPARMENRNNISIEYMSKSHGWNRIHFIAMDRKPGQPLEKVLFTIEQINEEKREVDEIREKIARAEKESKMKNVFLEVLSKEINQPIKDILKDSEAIINSSSDEQAIEIAKTIKSRGRLLVHTISAVKNYSKLIDNKYEIVDVNYSLIDVFREIAEIGKYRFEGKNVKFNFDISENLPVMLNGDRTIIKEIVGNMITEVVAHLNSGSIRLAAYEKTVEDNAHILISVKGEGNMVHPEKIKRSEAVQSIKESFKTLGINLKEIDNGESFELYFEIDQKIVDETPVGKIG